MTKALSSLLVLPGDGIGRVVLEATLPLFELLMPELNINKGDIGWHYWQTEQCAIPKRTWKAIYEADAILLGATTSKAAREAKNYLSPILELRQTLNLYANVRPCIQLKEAGKPYHFCIIRENSEGLYAGLDYSPVPDELLGFVTNHSEWKTLNNEQSSMTIRLQTRAGLERIFHYAFSYAIKHDLNQVTLADKPNVLRQSGDFARRCFESVAKRYPNIKINIMNVDAVAMKLVLKPETFGVIVAENMFGDILSDVGAAVMGGLGLAPSANIGNEFAYFEPVHGSAPSMSLDKPNPTAMFLSIALMFERFGFEDFSAWIHQAVRHVIAKGQCLTYDLNGSASCNEMAQAIIQQIKIIKSNNDK